MRNYPATAAAPGRVEPVARRIRGFLDGRPLFDTVEAIYVWEWAHYPHYYIPIADVDSSAISRASERVITPQGMASEHRVLAPSGRASGTVRIFDVEADPAVRGTARFEWDSLDAWFEEDEQVFVHPRNPYSRVDAIRSNRPIRVEVDGTVLADAPGSVMLFETGLPPRYYLERTSINFDRLQPSATRTACPYKGLTSHYWSFEGFERSLEDIAWAYDFPTLAVQAIAGRIAFYDEKVDTFVNGVLEDRPVTHFV